MGTTLGRNIKAFRKNKGFTQEELADLLNITPQAISKWESESGLPDVSMLIPLAQVLGVSTDALLGYDSITENEEIISRVKETVTSIRGEEKDRAKASLKVSEYLSTETTLNPGCFEIIKDYAEETANLSMYADPSIENRFPDDQEHIQTLCKDAIRKGVYLISHCNDKILIEKAHNAVAWIYIHMKDFDNAREHINVLPSIATGRVKEKISMELTFFESGFEKMKDDIAENSVLLFDAVSSFLNTIAQDYGWYNMNKEEAYEICDWCEGIVKAFAARRESINMTHYLRIRRSIAFFKMVAAKRLGAGEEAEKLYADFERGIQSENLTDDEKAEIMRLLNNDISYYARYT